MKEKLNERQLFIFPECSKSKIKSFIGIITSEEEWKHTSGALTEMPNGSKRKKHSRSRFIPKFKDLHREFFYLLHKRNRRIFTLKEYMRFQFIT